jgi:hypothetical protein
MSNNALSPIRGESAFFSAIIAGNAGNAMYFSPPLSLSFAAPTGPLAAAGLCDLATAAGNPCVAAHSTVRAMYSSYSGALYQVKRSDNSCAMVHGCQASSARAHATQRNVNLYVEGAHERTRQRSTPL